MQSVWKVPGGLSGVNPLAFAPGDPPPVLPPVPLTLPRHSPLSTFPP
ncbi:unnamed protein product [Brassica oleracea var. botrytis]